MNENATPSSTPAPDGRPPRCRRRGGALLLGGLGLGLALVLAFGAFQAVGLGPRHGGFGSHGGFCSHGGLTAGQVDLKIDRLTTWVMDDLEGTPEQRQKSAEILKAAARDLMPVHEELRANHERVTGILTAPAIDRAALETVRARQMELAEGASRRITQAVADLGDVLTAEQRLELMERARSFRHH